MLPVHDGRARSVAPGVVNAFVRNGFSHRLLPEDRAVPAVDGEHDEGFATYHRQIVVRAGTATGGGWHGLAGGYGRREENSIAPDDWRRMPAAWKC